MRGLGPIEAGYRASCANFACRRFSEVWTSLASPECAATPVAYEEAVVSEAALSISCAKQHRPEGGGPHAYRSAGCRASP